MKKHIVILGSGAVGQYFGSILVRSEYRVTFVARSWTLEEIRAHGIVVDSETNPMQVSDPDVVSSLADLPAAPDIVFVASKAVDNVFLWPAVREADVRPGWENTIWISLQNGLDSAPALAEAVTHGSTIAALAFVGVRREERYRTIHTSSGRIVAGPWPGGVSAEKIKELIASLSADGFPIEYADDMHTEIWRKVLWNVSFSPVTAILQRDHLQVLTCPRASAFLRQLLGEAATIAAVDGAQLGTDDIEKLVQDSLKIGPVRTSMAMDRANGRPMEIDAIVGATIRRGNFYGCEMATLKTIEALLFAMDCTSEAR